MAISINWTTKVITIPKADLSLISGDLYQYDVNSFRLELKSLEASLDGMPFLDTHKHNTTVLLSGVNYARIVEIVNGYTITFEDGQYRVSLFGANHNIGDVTNTNQVSLIISNSAGLINIDQEAIQYSSFGGGVTVDINALNSGTLYPNGNKEFPVSNIQDAVLIANERGFDKIFIIGSITLDTGDNIDNFTIVGQNPLRTLIIINPGASTIGCQIFESSITGTLDGGSTLRECVIGNLNYVNGYINHCVILESSIIMLGGLSTVYILNTSSGGLPGTNPILDCNGAGQEVVIRGYDGGLNIRNKTGIAEQCIDINSGQIILESTVSNGTIVVRGICHLINNSTGTAVIDTVGLLNKQDLTNNIWSNATRTLTSISQGGGATAQEVWEYGTRDLTSDVILDETSLHSALDSYTNKASYRGGGGWSGISIEDLEKGLSPILKDIKKEIKVLKKEIKEGIKDNDNNSELSKLNENYLDILDILDKVQKDNNTIDIKSLKKEISNLNSNEKLNEILNKLDVKIDFTDNINIIIKRIEDINKITKTTLSNDIKDNFNKTIELLSKMNKIETSDREDILDNISILGASINKLPINAINKAITILKQRIEALQEDILDIS